jgi:hypothetical protein
VEPTWIVLLAMALGVGVFLAVGASYRRKLAPLATLLDGGSGEVRGWFRYRVSGHLEGREVEFVGVPGSKNRPPQLRIRLACPVSLSLRIGREGIGARIAKGFHLMSDVALDDPELDAKYVFSSSDPESLKRWIREPGVRDALTALLDREGVDSISLRNGTLEAVQVRPGRVAYTAEGARRVVVPMQELVRSLSTGS